MSNIIKSTLFDNILNRLIKIITKISSLSLIILVLVVISEIFFRFLFNFPIIYTTELTQLFFPWLIFLGSILVTYKNGHMKIDFLNERLPIKIKFFNTIFIKSVMLFFSILVSISSFKFTQRFTGQIMPVLKISRFWFYSSMVFSFTVISIILIYQIITKVFKNEKN